MMARVVDSVSLLLGFVCFVLPLGEQSVVSFDKTSGCILLADASNPPSILVDAAAWARVLSAAGDLALTLEG